MGGVLWELVHQVGPFAFEMSKLFTSVRDIQQKTTWIWCFWMLDCPTCCKGASASSSILHSERMGPFTLGSCYLIIDIESFVLTTVRCHNLKPMSKVIAWQWQGWQNLLVWDKELKTKIATRHLTALMNWRARLAITKQFKELRPCHTFPLRAVSSSHFVSGSKFLVRLSNFSLAALDLWSSSPSLATFWNFLPSNSGMAEMQYSSTASVKYRTSNPFFNNRSTNGEFLTCERN